MNIAQIIRNYQKKIMDKQVSSSIFLDLADDIVMSFKHHLNQKTYLLIPDPGKELIEMSYEYFLSNGKTMPISMGLDISAIMNKFNEVAQKLGFTVITKMSEYHGDGLLFDLLGTESVDKGLVEEEFNDFPDVKVPLTISVDDFSFDPFFPVVFKNITANRGEDKYLIENHEQLKKIMSVFELPESKAINLKSEFVAQEYIESYENINSSIRILTSCTGEILSSVFLVSMDKSPKKRVKNFGIDVCNPCEYLSDPSSPYYLNSKNITSNVSGGGRVIPLSLGEKSFNAEDEIMLSLHNINVETLTLPSDIINQCKKIAMHLGSKKGIVLGIDFIYNSRDNNWYYLETNRNPSVNSYRRFMRLEGYQRRDVKTLMQLDSLIKIVENIMTKDLITENKRSK